MTPAQWKSFLKLYSREFLSHDWSNTIRIFSSHGAAISDEARQAQWLGFPPASEEAILAAEERLGLALPPSLRTFYQVTNGWGMTGSFIFEVFPVEQVAWLKDFDPHMYQKACETEARRSGPPLKDDPGNKRLEEFSLDQGTMVKRSLAVSPWGDAAIWLLDPGEPGNTGEWRAGRWAAWTPGMVWTADSFADLMRNEFKSLRAKDETQ